MNITPENWSTVEREIKEEGIEETIYDEKGFLKTIVSKNGTRYELPVEVLSQLVNSGAVKFKVDARSIRR